MAACDIFMSSNTTLRDLLMRAYGEDIRTLLQQASTIQEPATTALQEGEPF
jgi:hypothetical protein